MIDTYASIAIDILIGLPLSYNGKYIGPDDIANNDNLGYESHGSNSAI